MQPLFEVNCVSSGVIVAVGADYNTNNSSSTNNQSFHQIWCKFMHYFLGYLVGQAYTLTQKYLLGARQW